MALIPEPFSSVQFHSSAFVTVHGIRILAKQLHFCSQEKFTGRLDLKIQDAQIRPWSLYFHKGNLIWGSGGIHPVRRWYRQLSQHCSATTIASMYEQEARMQHWNDDSFIALLATNDFHQNIEKMVNGLASDIFFDLYQEWSRYYYSNLQMKFFYTKLDSVPSTLSGVSIEQVWLQALQEWTAWQQAELESYSPNQAPSTVNNGKLQQQVLPTTYQNLVTMVNGQRSLRDLAVKTNKHLITLTKTLVPYIYQDLIQLSDIEDLQVAQASDLLLTQASSLLPFNSPLPQKLVPLIAHIDDSPEEGRHMSQILTKMGYGYLHIQNPIQALPLLLDQKPDLIFLDLVMPVVNGYEACAQIRRIARFKDIPIIILTSNDGIVDRVRARIVGSTDFLAKPIQSQKVQAILQKYRV